MAAPTTTFQALSYADRIRQAQSSNRNPSSTTASTFTTSKQANGTSRNESQADASDEIVAWQEVVGRSKKETKMELSRASGSSQKPTGNGGKRDEASEKSRNQSSSGSSSDARTRDELIEGSKAGRATTAWAGLTGSKSPPPPSSRETARVPPTSKTIVSESSNPVDSDRSAAPTSTKSPGESIESTVITNGTGGETPNRLPQINIWQARKEKMTMAPPLNAQASSSSSPKSVFSAMSSGPLARQAASKGSVKTEASNQNGSSDPKPSSSKASLKSSQKQSTGKGTAALPNLADDSAWPDVVLAATVTKAAVVPEKSKVGIREDAEERPSVPSVPKKTKWKAIPAAEMQEALDRMQKQKKADQAAEAKGRKVASNGTSSGPGDVAGKQGAPGSSSSPKKSVTHVTPASGTTGGKKNRSGSVSNTLETGKKSKASGNKGERPGQDAAINKLVDPVLRKVEEDAFETTNGSRIEMAATGQKKSATEAGVSSSDGVSTLPEASTINSTKPSSADRGRSHPLNLTSSKAETTPASSATMASQSQHSQISYGRGGSSGTPSTRGSRGGRGARGGRGGGAGQAGPGRSHSEQGSPLTSPPNGRSPSLPGHTATQSYPRRSGDYQKTQSSASFGLPSPYYGVPYHYPVMTGGFVPPADGNLEAYGQAAYAGGAAPFPRPVTQISGLDSLRSFILGQLEYYFSMQNLAMDFFLRQQMDNQGWVDINMISSFNRIKSLTAEVETVKDVAKLSTILEVCDGNIRLAHDQWRQWVLPDARPSDIADEGTPSSPYAGEMPFGMPGLDLTSQARNKLVGDIHRDVMRVNPMSAPHLQAAAGLTKSVPGGLEAESAASQTTTTDEAALTKTNTPATSVSDEQDPHDKLEIIL